MTKENIPEFFTKSLQAVMAGLVAILAWLLTQMYGQITDEMEELSDKVDEYYHNKDNDLSFDFKDLYWMYLDF